MKRWRLLGGGIVVVAAAVVTTAWLRAAVAGPLLYTLPVAAVNAIYSTTPAYRDPLALDQRSGHAFVATSAGIALLDTRGGRSLRTIPLSANAQGFAQSLVADQQTGRIIVVGGATLVLDARTGAVLRAAGQGALPNGMVLNERSGDAFVLVVRSYDEEVRRLDARSGRLLGATEVDQMQNSMGISSLAVDQRTGRVAVSSPDDDSVSILDGYSGRIVAGGMVGRFPSAVTIDQRSGHLFVASNRGVTVLDERNGVTLHTINLGMAPVALALDERANRLFAVNANGNTFGAEGISGVSVLDARRGTLLRTVPLPATTFPAQIAVDERRGRVYVSSQGPPDPASSSAYMGQGYLYVFDARDGRLLRTLRAGVAPIALAVDERSGHVVVLDNGGLVRRSDPWAGAPSWLRHLLGFVMALPTRHAPYRGDFAYQVVGSSVAVIDPAR